MIQATIVFKKNWDALSDESVRYILNSGSSRSSKTHSIIQLFYLYATSNPMKKLSVFRDTKKMCKDTILDDMKKIYPYMPGFSSVSLNVTESVYRFANGSTIHIEGTDDPVKIHGYHCDILWFNESYNIQEDTFDQLDMRCAGKVIIDLNPRMNHWSDKFRNGHERSLVIHSTFKDNPFCPVEQKKKILSYQPVKKCQVVLEKILTENEAKEYDLLNNPKEIPEKDLKELIRCRENEDKRSANDFNWDVYGLGIKGERPHRIFRWNQISLEDYRKLDVPVYYYSDWGTVDPWAIGEVKYYDGNLYVRQLNYESENKIRERLQSSELSQIQSIDADQQDRVGIVTWMFNKLGIGMSNEIICDSNRPLKIAFLRRSGWTQAKPTVKSPTSILDGIGLLQNLNVFYTNDSTDIEYEQENYSWEIDSSGNVLEKPQDIDNHHIDGVRYVGLYLKQIGIIREV